MKNYQLLWKYLNFVISNENKEIELECPLILLNLDVKDLEKMYAELFGKKVEYTEFIAFTKNYFKFWNTLFSNKTIKTSLSIWIKLNFSLFSL